LRADENLAAQRPDSRVREAVVVAVFLLLGEPDPPQRVALVFGRHGQVILVIDRPAICSAAAVSDPNSAAGAHDRLERGYHAAGRRSALDVAVHVIMLVRLAI